MRKTISLFIIVIFVLSIVPLAFAMPMGVLGNDGVDAVKAELYNKENNDGAQEDAQIVKKRIQERIQNLKVKRDISAKRLRTANERYNLAKERYQEAKSVHEERKNMFEKAKLRLRNCKDNESEECQQIRVEVHERAKEYVSNNGERILGYLEKVLAKIEGSEDLTEEQAAEASEKIETAMNDIEEANMEQSKK